MIAWKLKIVFEFPSLKKEVDYLNSNQKKILHEAIIQFNSQGVNFKLDDIASALKMSKKTLYKYYESKEALLSAIIDSLFAEIKRKEHEVYEDHSLSNVERLISLLAVYPDFEVFNYHQIPALKKVYPDLYERVDQHLESNWDETFSLLSICIASGEIKPIEPHIFKILFLGLYKQLLLEESHEPEKLMRTCIETIIYGMIQNH